ncbi:MAG: DUF5666 domain-containing protein [Chloroflexota bacterium]
MFTHPPGRIALVTVLAAIVALLALASSALAQSPTGEVEVVGVVKAIEGGTTLTVNGLRIDAAGAEIKTAIMVGAAVKVEGTLQPDGTILAREVKAAEDEGLLPGESEFIGTLAGLSGTTATVNGLVFDIASAEIEPGLAAGMVVKVHARLSDGGVWVARAIERFVPAAGGTPEGHVPIPAGAECTQCHETQPGVAAPSGLVKVDDDGLEIIGTLDEIGENYVVVAGQRYDTTGAEMKGALVVGTLVKIELTRLDSGILIAREVKPTPFVDDMDDDSDGDGDDDSDDGDSDDSDEDSDACQFEVEVSSASLRSGPGTGYDVIGYAFDDDKLPVLAVDATGTWVKVATATGEAWIAVNVGELEDDCDGLTVTDDLFKDDDDDDGDDGDDSGDDSSDDSSDDSGDDDGDDGDDHGDDSGDDDHGDDGDEHEDEGEHEEEGGD